MTDPLPEIQDKHDLASAQRLVKLGYPDVAAYLPVMLEWIQDINWPVARILAPFLASVGAPMIPHLWRVLRSDDQIWKYWCISEVIAHMEPVCQQAFSAELMRLRDHPLDCERDEGLHELAGEILQTIPIEDI